MRSAPSCSLRRWRIGRWIIGRWIIGSSELALVAALATATLAAPMLAVGCGGTEDDAPALPPATPGTVVYPYEDTATSIEFLDATDELTLVAGTPREIRVRVLPPGEHIVRFALLQAEDAFLSTDFVTTARDGIGSTTLTALTASPGFSLLALVGRLPQALRVVALEANLGSLLLQALYPGSRTVPRWVASVHVGRTCADLTGPPFPDGDALASSNTRDVQINRVPAGTPLAAVIRAERFAFGCRNISGLRAGSNTISEIEVVDRPLQMAELDLRLSFSLEQAASLNPALEELAFRAVGPLLGTAADDLAAALDAMSSVASDSVAFEQARTERNWRGVLVDALGGIRSGSGLRTAIDGWMSTGLAELSEPDAIVGTLAAPDAAGQAPFTLTSVTGLVPADAGFIEQNVAAVSTDTGDVVRVAATLSWQPTPLLAVLAQRAATLQTGASSVPDALARELDCASIAELLVDAGTGGEAFPDCDDDCVLSLCDRAMEVLWARVTDTPQTVVPWEITGASRAEINADARPTSVSGNWVGSLTLSGSGDAPVQGAFVGSVPD